MCVCVRHQEYEVDGVTYMRMKFYVKGSQRTGTVHLDMKKVCLHVGNKPLFLSRSM